MKAFRIADLSGAPSLQDIDAPRPAKDEVLVQIRACGLNFADLLMAKGNYQDQPETPFTLGMEYAGDVIALGPEVTDVAVGTRVAVFAGQGGLAEQATVRADRCLPLPDSMSYEHAAAMQVAYGTSHLALDYKAQLKRGETLLVLGAAGGVGLTAVELGKRMGARVIACARGPDKLAVAQKAGADHVIDSASEDLRVSVKALGGADVVYDPVGGDLSRDAMRATRPDGRIILVGFASGSLPELKPNHLLVKNVTVIGFWWGGYLNFAPDVLTRSMGTLFDWYDDGGLRPHISHVIPLADAAKGLDLLRSRQSTGKVVVTP